LLAAGSAVMVLQLYSIYTVHFALLRLIGSARETFKRKKDWLTSRDAAKEENVKAKTGPPPKAFF